MQAPGRVGLTHAHTNMHCCSLSRLSSRARTFADFAAADAEEHGTASRRDCVRVLLHIWSSRRGGVAEWCALGGRIQKWRRNALGHSTLDHGPPHPLLAFPRHVTRGRVYASAKTRGERARGR